MSHYFGSVPKYDSSRLGDPIGGKYVLDAGVVVQKYPGFDGDGVLVNGG